MTKTDKFFRDSNMMVCPDLQKTAKRPTKEQIDKKIEEFRASNQDSPGNNAILIRPEGVYHSITGGGCFGGTLGAYPSDGSSYEYFKNTTAAYYHASANFWPKGEEKVLSEFADFIVNRSLFKDVFLDKDGEKNFRTGIRVDVDMPTQLIVPAAQEFRYTRSRNGKNAILWGRLRQVVPENAALVLTHVLYERKKKFRLINDFGWYNTSVVTKSMYSRMVDGSISRDLHSLRESSDFYKQYLPFTKKEERKNAGTRYTNGVAYFGTSKKSFPEFKDAVDYLPDLAKYETTTDSFGYTTSSGTTLQVEPEEYAIEFHKANYIEGS